jgi:hypothetical protein
MLSDSITVAKLVNGQIATRGVDENSPTNECAAAGYAAAATLGLKAKASGLFRSASLGEPRLDSRQQELNKTRGVPLFAHETISVAITVELRVTHRPDLFVSLAVLVVAESRP